MLVLTRKLGEQVVLGDEIAISVVSLQGNRVRIGIQAPPHVSIRRAELVPAANLVRREVAVVGRDF